eukprot:CAMPEP_0181231320 /NCGR_PEP_ID=MMETSP1096-20121128/35032_1 /TAXON_ID=156174 ORGANISM="Chrysochromulina ericina, Strain CCMP281" /NCGR_SAMPLE_ID=MMETSP1096 /ASSEMBLY_ACC=CAM_ASM_000453 /LENGTH=86 /DNA_ID=CAMNT_0023325331 /DNA_START=77 /DNA_END=338 /DNA_ORIENTATION=-
MKPLKRQSVHTGAPSCTTALDTHHTDSMQTLTAGSEFGAELLHRLHEQVQVLEPRAVVCDVDADGEPSVYARRRWGRAAGLLQLHD